MIKLWHSAPWYIRLILGVFIPLVLVFLLVSGGWRAVVAFLEQLKRKEVDNKVKELQDKRAGLEGKASESTKKLAELDREKDAKKAQVDKETGKDLADSFNNWGDE